jgi:hypothetical protein
MNSPFIRAHHKNAFSRLAIVLIICTALNLAGIGIADKQFHFIQNITQLSPVLYIPLFIGLLLPTIIIFFFFYTGTLKKYEIVYDENGFHFKLHSNNISEFKWKEITGYRFIDFEDNHYFAFEANGVKADFILHRNKYDFDSFLEVFLKQTALPNKEH